METPALNISILSKNPACTNDIYYSKLIQLRTTGSSMTNPITPVTSIDGRTTGNNIIFTQDKTYDMYKRRRKEGVLQYPQNNEYKTTKKKYLSHIVSVAGSTRISQARIRSLLVEACEKKENELKDIPFYLSL